MTIHSYDEVEHKCYEFDGSKLQGDDLIQYCQLTIIVIVFWLIKLVSTK